MPFTKSVATAGAELTVAQNPPFTEVATLNVASPPGSRNVVLGVPIDGEELTELEGLGDEDGLFDTEELGLGDDEGLGDEDGELLTELDGDGLLEAEVLGLDDGDADGEGDEEGLWLGECEGLVDGECEAAISIS